MKVIEVNEKQSTSVSLIGVLNCGQVNTKDLSKMTIMKRMKLQSTVGEQITTLTRIRRKLLIRKAS